MGKTRIHLWPINTLVLSVTRTEINTPNGHCIHNYDVLFNAVTIINKGFITWFVPEMYILSLFFPLYYSTGFAVFYDFILGLDPSVSTLRLVVSLVNRYGTFGEPTILPSVFCEPDTSGRFGPYQSHVAILGTKQPVPKWVLVMNFTIQSNTSEAVHQYLSICGTFEHQTFSLIRLMACSHCTGPGTGQGMGNDGFLYYTMYCTHYTGTGTWTGNHCFLLCPSRSLSLSRSLSHAVCMSHNIRKNLTLPRKINRKIW